MTTVATERNRPARAEHPPDRHSARRRAPGRWELATSLLVVLAAAALSSNGVFDGAAWWWLAVAVAALVLYGCAGLRAAGAPAWLAPAGAAALVVMLVTAVFGGGAGFLLVIPTPGSLARVHAMIGAGAEAIVQESIPAAQSEPLMLFVVLGTAVAALAMDLLAVTARMPALCGIPVLMLLSLPVVFLDAGVNPLWIVLNLATYLMLLVVAGGRTRELRRTNARRGMLAAAGSVVLALVIGLTAPGFSAVGTLPSANSGSVVAGGVNPLIDLGKDLRKPVPAPVLSYTSTAPSDLYLQLTTLDSFTGATWRRSDSDRRPLGGDGSVGAVPGLESKVTSTAVTTTVTVRQLRSSWLPAPYPARSIRGLDGRWSVAEDDLTIASQGGSAAGQHYTVRSLQLTPTPAQLKAAGNHVPASVQRDLDLPSHVPESIVAAAEKAVKGADSDYQKAVALQAFFRDGSFTYSLQTPLKEGYDGDGLKVIAKFLKVKSGYCVHFASAMAVMARILGIPARVAIGYLPGHIGSYEGESGYHYTVTSDQLHSWPELYFSGIGWLAFEPTVGLGVLPAYSIPAIDDSTPAPETSQSAAPQPTATTALPNQGEDVGADRDGPIAAHPDLRTLGIIVIVLLILCVPAAAARIRSAVRRRQVRRGRRPATAVWREVDAAARDLGSAAPGARTPREFAAGLRVDGDAAAAVMRLRDAVERELFAPEQAVSQAWRRRMLGDLETVRRGMARRAGPWRRFTAAVAPASLLRPAALGSPTSPRTA